MEKITKKQITRYTLYIIRNEPNKIQSISQDNEDCKDVFCDHMIVTDLIWHDQVLSQDNEILKLLSCSNKGLGLGLGLPYIKSLMV